jgi:Transposase DDE domain/Transposase domain (DUF772)
MKLPSAPLHVTVRQQLQQFADVLQGSLFPRIEQELGPLTGSAQLLVEALAMVPLERWLPRNSQGRPRQKRSALAAAFLAKSIYGFTHTRQLIEQLQTNAQLRRCCGWRHASQVPHEATFSRAFAEFARTHLAQHLHTALIEKTQSTRLIGHLSRDSTAIPVRERLSKKVKKRQAQKAQRKLRRKPRQSRARQRGTLIQRQRGMTLKQMLDTLSTECDGAVKVSSKGQAEYWRGFKLHLDVADGQIPISAVLTSASVHDVNVAIPLMTMSAERVTWCYDLMDSAYDANAILAHSRQLQHVPIVDPHPRRNGRSRSQLPKLAPPPKLAPELTPAELIRYRERTAVERVFARLKDEFGARHIRVRGPAKVMAHLSFAVLALTVDQLIKLTG